VGKFVFAYFVQRMQRETNGTIWEYLSVELMGSHMLLCSETMSPARALAQSSQFLYRNQSKYTSRAQYVSSGQIGAEQASGLSVGTALFVEEYNSKILQFAVRSEIFLCLLPHTWHAKENFELQLRSDNTTDEIFFRILRCRQFCWPPKLSGCPFCHCTKLLTKSSLPFEVHH
jgi:hypothetical protein